MGICLPPPIITYKAFLLFNPHILYFDEEIPLLCFSSRLEFRYDSLLPGGRR